MPENNGWNGTLLYIDLSSEKIHRQASMDIASTFIGGRLMASRLYWDMVTAQTGALDPGNVLMFMPGPLTGSGAVACSRWIMAAKSPYLYPEQFGFGNAGGFFGAAIKQAGFDGIIATGRAEKLSYILIENGTVTLKDAGGLQGLKIDETMKRLHDAHGSRARIVCIGPAGESLVRFATAGTDQGGNLSNGMGAVMGSKNIKAVVIKADGRVGVADPAGLQSLNKKIRRLRKGRNEILYTSEPMLQGIERGKNMPCHACPAGCTRAQFKHVSGMEQTLQMCASSHCYNVWDKKYYGEPSENAFMATALCNTYGLCTGEMTNLVWFLEKGYEMGLLNEETTGLPLSKIGSLEFIQSFMETVTSRNGLGDALARGTRRLSISLGPEAEKMALRRITRHGYHDDAYGPRLFLTNALFYATEARNPIIQLHEYSFTVLKWIFWYATSGMMSSMDTKRLKKIAARNWGGEEAVDFTTYDGKARAAFIIQNGSHAKEAMVACDRFYPLLDDDQSDDGMGDPAMVAKLFTAVTGESMTEADYYTMGERAANLQRAIAVREGWQGRSDDAINDFHFNEPVETEEGLIGVFNPDLEFPGPGEEIISRKGCVFDRREFERMKDEYYKLRGWDSESGLQGKNKLESLNLSFVVPELKALKKIR
jgi:aldehyde:ferredoxin oxidoreductase